MTWTTESRSTERDLYGEAGRTRPTWLCRNGERSVTTKAESWWPSATTPMWATPGNGPIVRTIPNEKLAGLPDRNQLYPLRHDALISRSQGFRLDLRYADKFLSMKKFLAEFASGSGLTFSIGKKRFDRLSVIVVVVVPIVIITILGREVPLREALLRTLPCG